MIFTSLPQNCQQCSMFKSGDAKILIVCQPAWHYLQDRTINLIWNVNMKLRNIKQGREYSGKCYGALRRAGQEITQSFFHNIYK